MSVGVNTKYVTTFYEVVMSSGEFAYTQLNVKSMQGMLVRERVPDIITKIQAADFIKLKHGK